jgi:hypothetical protein
MTFTNSIVLTTVSVDVFITETVPSAILATYTLLLDGL